MKNVYTTVGAMALSLSTAAQADIIHADDVLITEQLLCVGTDCVDGEPDITGNVVPRNGLKIKANNTAILFDDTSVLSNRALTDWKLKANEDNLGGLNAFFLQDATNGTQPFITEAGAPDSSLHILPSGRIGLGTAIPAQALHIVNGPSPRIRLEALGVQAFVWDLAASVENFSIIHANTSKTPLLIQENAPTDSIFVESSGNVGFGTSSPDAQLEISSDQTFNFFRITATGAATNESVDITFTQGPLGTGQLRYNIVDGDNQEMSLDADGNMVLDGTLTTTGPTCAGGCDRVFDEGFDLPTIKEHASDMFAAGHLPSLTPTVADQPVNLTEKLGEVINALEHAHIFIAQQEVEMDRMRDAHEAVLARLNALEMR